MATKVMTIFLFIAMLGCEKFKDTAESKKQDAATRLEESLKSTNEVSKYADCIMEATTDKAVAECEKMRQSFSEHTKQIMQKSKEPQ